MAENEAGSVALSVVKYVAWIIYAVLVFACIVLAFGFALLLFGADPDVGFAEFIYESAGRFMDPFRGLVEPTVFDSGSIAAWSALFAIAFYLVAMWVVSLVASWARRSLIRRNRAARNQTGSEQSPPQ